MTTLQVNSAIEQEAVLLQQINTPLPVQTLADYQELNQKLRDESITPDEHAHLRTLVDVVELADAERMQHLSCPIAQRATGYTNATVRDSDTSTLCLNAIFSARNKARLLSVRVDVANLRWQAQAARTVECAEVHTVQKNCKLILF